MGGRGAAPPAPSPGDAQGPGTHLPRAEHRLLELPSRGCSRSRCWGLAPAGPRGGGGPGPSPGHGARPRAGKLRHAAPQNHRAPLSGSQPAAVLAAEQGEKFNCGQGNKRSFLPGLRETGARYGAGRNPASPGVKAPERSQQCRGCCLRSPLLVPRHWAMSWGQASSHGCRRGAGG